MGFESVTVRETATVASDAAVSGATVDGAASSQSAGRKNTYSRRRWSAFDVWQEHARKSAAAMSATFDHWRDRDLRSTTVTG